MFKKSKTVKKQIFRSLAGLDNFNKKDRKSVCWGSSGNETRVKGLYFTPREINQSQLFFKKFHFSNSENQRFSHPEAMRYCYLVSSINELLKIMLYPLIG
jgi:hypothetical protein